MSGTLQNNAQQIGLSVQDFAKNAMVFSSDHGEFSQKPVEETKYAQMFTHAGHSVEINRNAGRDY